MTKLKAIDRLNKRVPPMKPKAENIANGITNAVKKARKRIAGAPASNLERSPKNDVLVRSNPQTSTAPKKAEGKKVDTKTRLGDFLVSQNRLLAEKYMDDLDWVAQQIPEASFYRELNTTNTKELPSILDKLEKRTEQYSERGYSGVIRDGVRATMFIPEADKNYVKIVKEMQKKGYKIAKTFAEDSKGNIVLDKNGIPKMVDDVDVRFADNAVPSGYEDVQMRFEKNGNLYELLILPGPNYLATKNKEHELVYENFRKYDTFVKDDGAREIIKAIKKEYHKLTKRLYVDAKQRDVSGPKKSEQITFTHEGVETVDNLFKSLKTLFLGKFNAQPPSKRSKPNFKQTKTYQNLDNVEQRLRKVIDLYKPID